MRHPLGGDEGVMQNVAMPTSVKTPQGVAAKQKKPTRARTHKTTGLLRAAGAPLWQQVVQLLRDDILKGQFPAGSRMPTEEELSEKFSVSRQTVRAALQQLRVDGLVSSKQGSGTTVMPPPPSASFNVHRVSSIDELIAYAAESRYAVERTGLVDGDAVASEHLDVPRKGKWLRLQGFRYGADAASPPICWTEVFVASDYAGVERLMPRQRGPIWQLIEDMYGERLVEVEQTLSVRGVPAELAQGLQVEPDSSVVEVRRTYKTTTGKVAEVSINLYPAAKFRFSMKLGRA
jgi:GntR family transcriptional regulator